MSGMLRFQKTQPNSAPQQPLKQATGSLSQSNNFIGLNNGDAVRTENRIFVVDSVLGSGGFGTVYRVSEGAKVFALKTEIINKKVYGRLKIEHDVLKSIHKRGKTVNLLQMEDYGKTAKFRFVVVNMVGNSLEDFRASLRNDLSFASAIHVFTEGMTAICDLHEVGFVHRDVKPDNLCLGGSGNVSSLKLIDYGLARRIIDSSGNLRPPRIRAGFRGTKKFAPRAAHLGLDQGRHCDVESLLYTFFDLISRKNGLSWSENKNSLFYMEAKARFFSREEFTNFYTWSPFLLSLWKIVDRVKSYTYGSTPEYKLMTDDILEAAKEHGVNLDPCDLDWNKAKDEPDEKIRV